MQKKLTGSQLSLPHGIKKKLKCETKNKMISMMKNADRNINYGISKFYETQMLSFQASVTASDNH